MIKRDRGLVAIIQMQNDPFFDSLWPFYMIKINLALINLVILHLYRTKRTTQKTKQMMQKRCKNTEPARSQKTEQTMQIGPSRSQKTEQIGPNNNVFFHGVSGGRAAEHN